MSEENTPLPEHKPLPVLGYKPQSAATVVLVNRHKVIEEAILVLLDAYSAEPAIEQRWLSIGRTHIEQAFMAINRAVFNPERVKVAKAAVNDPS